MTEAKLILLIPAWEPSADDGPVPRWSLGAGLSHCSVVFRCCAEVLVSAGGRPA